MPSFEYSCPYSHENDVIKDIHTCIHAYIHTYIHTYIHKNDLKLTKCSLTLKRTQRGYSRGDAVPFNNVAQP